MDFTYSNIVYIFANASPWLKIVSSRDTVVNVIVPLLSQGLSFIVGEVLTINELNEFVLYDYMRPSKMTTSCDLT